jgi:hypothetical protein
MNIEVKHDPLNLPSKILLKVKWPMLAQRRLEGWLETKHQSFRLRYIVDHPNKTVELGARCRANMDEAIREIKKSGQYVRVEPWFNKMTALQRSRKMDTSFGVTLT